MQKNKMNAKFFGILTFVVFLAIALTATALSESWYEDSADIGSLRVYVDGNMIWSGRCTGDSSADQVYCYTYQTATPALIRGETMPVKIVFTPNEDLGNIRLRIHINSYRTELVDKTVEFDAFDGNQYSKDLAIAIPSDIDAKDTYTLYVKLESRHELTGVDEAKIDLSVQRVANDLSILSVELLTNKDNYHPGNSIYADVVVKNVGNHDSDDVYVKLSIKELGISRTVYLGDLTPTDCERCDKEDTQRVSVVLSLPLDKTGSYTLEAQAYNSELSETVSKLITVKNPSLINILPQYTNRDVAKGQTTSYNVVFSNFGDTAETFSVNVIGLDGWATAQTTPSTFILGAGESKVVSIAITADEDASEGSHPFLVKTRYGGNTKDMQFNANVKTSFIDWSLVLLIIGIVLAAGIIVLLIAMLSKKKKVEEETPETYY